jgi:AcrR family transcriptional regulator
VQLEVQEMRQVFIDSAVRVVARDGMEKTTTKAIASEAKLNEAYIYKCFSGKDDLLSAALHMEDVNIANLLQKTLPIMHMPGSSMERAGLISSGKRAGP